MMKERTLRVLEFTKIRDRLASKAMTDMGRERCEALVPSSNMTCLLYTSPSPRDCS